VDKNEQLAALAGEDGADVLKGAQMAVDDLENAGIVAKDLNADTEAAPEVEAEAADVDQNGQDPVEKETTKPDLAAMKEAIDKLAAASKEDAAAERAEDPDPEVVQLREMVTTLRQEVDELKQHVDAQAALELIGTVATAKRVRDGAAEQQVVFAAAGDRDVAAAADQLVDSRDRVGIADRLLRDCNNVFLAHPSPLVFGR
jgi:hypothetical protein